MHVIASELNSAYLREIYESSIEKVEWVKATVA